MSPQAFLANLQLGNTPFIGVFALGAAFPANSSRLNQRASSSSVVSGVTGSDGSASAVKPSMIAKSLATGFSRFPVAGPDFDDVVGVVHVKDVYRLPVERRASASVADVITEPFIVPESRELSSLLEVSRNVTATLDLQALFSLILDQIKTLIDYSGATIFSIQGHEFRILDYRGPISRDQLAQRQRRRF